MQKNAKKNLDQLAQKMNKNQIVATQQTTAIKGGSQGVSTFDLVL